MPVQRASVWLARSGGTFSWVNRRSHPVSSGTISTRTRVMARDRYGPQRVNARRCGRMISIYWPVYSTRSRPCRSTRLNEPSTRASIVTRAIGRDAVANNHFLATAGSSQASKTRSAGAPKLRVTHIGAQHRSAIARARPSSANRPGIRSSKLVICLGWVCPPLTFQRPASGCQGRPRSPCRSCCPYRRKRP